jgi:hypothetical protein
MAQADTPAETQSPALAPFITVPLRDVPAWVAAFDAREIPVLAATANTYWKTCAATRTRSTPTCWPTACSPTR